jgi:hypothetical protein
MLTKLNGKNKVKDWNKKAQPIPVILQEQAFRNAALLIPFSSSRAIIQK